MIQVSRFVDQLVDQGANFFTGIPCSFLTPLINEVIARQETEYVLASSEGDALAIASGVWLGGKTAVVLCQNSGLGNMVNPLTSLNQPFGIPVLLLLTWRGKPGIKDEPQHRLMGEITPDLLSLLGVEWTLLPEQEEAALSAVQKACAFIRREGRSYALVMAGDAFAGEDESTQKETPAALPSREEVLRTFLDNRDPNAAVVATTGKTGRELFTLTDDSRHFYCIGSMGYASSIAHGIVLSTSKRVYLLDGDGAAIMHLGNLTSIGASRPGKLTHIILDNRTYDSTGGQSTASATVDFPAIGLGSGYASARSCNGAVEFADALRCCGDHGPYLLHVPISVGSMVPLGRQTETPHVVARRLKEWLAQ